MALVQINGLNFLTETPSRYVYCDFPGVSITFVKRVVRTTKSAKLVKRPGGKYKKIPSKTTRITIREWVLDDGHRKIKSASLTEACARLRQALRKVSHDVL